MLAFAYKTVKLKIENRFGGTADLRMASQKAVSVSSFFSQFSSSCAAVACRNAVLVCGVVRLPYAIPCAITHSFLIGRRCACVQTLSIKAAPAVKSPL